MSKALAADQVPLRYGRLRDQRLTTRGKDSMETGPVPRLFAGHYGTLTHECDTSIYVEYNQPRDLPDCHIPDVESGHSGWACPIHAKSSENGQGILDSNAASTSEVWRSLCPGFLPAWGCVEAE
jgi:hypothetical protein